MAESTLERIFSHYTHCRPAQRDDEPQLVQFMNQQPMKTKRWSLSFQRGQDYFSFYRLSGNSFFPFVMTNHQNEICGSSGLIRLSTSINHQPKTLGYLCDLRVDPHAPVQCKSEWRSIYSDIIHQLPFSPNPEEKCDYFVTAIFDTNTPALKVLTKKLRGISYLPLQQYMARSMILRPWPKLFQLFERQQHIITTPQITLKYLQQWLKMNSQAIGLPYLPDLPTQEQYLKHLENHWALNNPFPVLEVVDSFGNTLGGCWPWLSSQVRSPILSGLNPWHQFVGQMLPYLGQPPIENNQPLGQVYLTHLMIDPRLPMKVQRQVLRRLVLSAFTLAIEHNAHMITWIEGKWPSAPRAYIPDAVIFNLSATMYQVVPQTKTTDPQSLLPDRQPLYLEGASL